jgi:hypothetical protein
MYSTVNRIFHFSYLYSDYLASGLTVTGLSRVYYINLVFFPFMVNIPPRSFFLVILLDEGYRIEASYYAAFSIFLLLPPSLAQVQIFSARCYELSEFMFFL